MSGVVALQKQVGNRAVARLLQRAPAAPTRTVADIERELEAVRREIGEVRGVGNDLVEQELGRRPASPGKTHGGLKGVEKRGGSHAESAKRLRKELEELEKRAEELRKELTKARGGGLLAGSAGAAGGREAAKEAEGAGVKEGENVAVKEFEKAAVKEGEKAATKGGRLYARVLAKVGIELLEALVPDPLDALSLMVDFAGSYAEAREAIRRRNLESGFSIGWAAYLVIPRWEWARSFAYTTVSRDVVTEILGAAGVAENAFNEGLVRGFIYGEKHTTTQADKVRQKAFDAVLTATGHTPGRYDDDDLYTFGRDDVYLFAGALRLATTEVLAEADRRRAARLERERLAKHAEEVNRRFGTGASWPR
ncbi:MAG TPA: hypothetical protein VH279_04920 [Solirubrobacteraceae bacterium]|nr:hypothetical protein [Solirubrobacteraceae bacterium]